MKLMLVDDHPLFIEGLQYLLGTYGIEVSGVANNGSKALELARTLKPDIILMDVKMPYCSGIDALKLIKAEMPEIKIVMLTTSEEDEDLFNAVRCGATGYLLKSTNAKELVGMLRDLEKGEIPLSPGLAIRLIKEFRRSSANEEEHSQNLVEENKRRGLSDRQLEILELIASGMTYKQAGDALGITERTLKYHMGRIIDLLHLENRTQVIVYATSMGLIKNKKDDD